MEMVESIHMVCAVFTMKFNYGGKQKKSCGGKEKSLN